MGDQWFKTNYPETIYSPSGTVLPVTLMTTGYVNSGTDTFTVRLTSRYSDTAYNPDNSKHANGVQFVHMGLNISGALNSGETITSAFIIGAGQVRNLGSSYGTGSNQWYFYADVTTTTIRIYIKGSPSVSNSGQYAFQFHTSQARVLTVYVSLSNMSVANNVMKFSSVGVEYVPNGYPFSPDISTVNGTSVPYVNSRWLMVSDGLYYDSNTNMPWAKDSNGIWYVHTGSPNYYGVASTITNTYSDATMHLYYPKFVNNTKTVVDMGQKAVGSAYTVPADSEAGTRTHYTFDHWEYNGQVVTAGSTIRSYPEQTSLTSSWNTNVYTVSFSIDQSFNPSPSSVASRNVTYGTSTILPTLTSSTADFVGWSDGNTTYAPGVAYSPTANITLTAVFNNKQFTVRFYDVDGTEISGSSQTVTYPATVTTPSAPSRPHLTFQGWAVRGTNTPIVAGSSDGSTYQPLNNTDLIRVYTYTLTLKDLHGNYGQSVTAYDGYYTTGLTIQVPTPTSNIRPMKGGYRFTGWSKTNQQLTDPIPITATPPTPDFMTSPLSIDLNVDYNELYAVFSPAELLSVTIDLSSQNVKVNQAIDIPANKVTVNPSDWLGTLQWTSEPAGQSYFTIVKNANDNGARLTGVSQTSGHTARAVLKGLKRTWDSDAGYVSAGFNVTVSSYIEVVFYTRNADGESVQYASGWVDDSNNDYVWVSGSFPSNPTRDGFVFDGWVSAEGNVITSSDDDAPHYPMDVYATWLHSYEPRDRDTLILQRYNPDGTSLVQHIDVGVIASLNENLRPSLTTMPTPTKSSDATFITDLSVTGTINVSITRKNPAHPNDLSDDSLNWSNGGWIYNLRNLVDRWQSETDGIKALFIPRGLTHATIDGEDVYFGDNYDLLGYVKPRQYQEGGVTKYNSGLLYDSGTKVLIGYNCLITSYSDTYTAGSPDVVTVSMTFTLGGMSAEYEEMAKALLIGE